MFDEARLPAHALMQDPAFLQALRLCGQAPQTLPCGLTVLLRRIAGVPFAMLPRAAPPCDLTQQLRQIGLHRRLMILSPETPCALPLGLRLRGPRRLAWLNLSRDADQMRRGLHPKWRNQLRKSEAAGLKVMRAPLAQDPNTGLLALESAQTRLRGYANWPAPLTAAFAAAAPDQTHVFTAHLKGCEIAQMLFLAHGTGATYHIGHTTPQGRITGAHNLLMWQAMRYFADRGYQRIDLGLLDQKTPGLNRFKLRTGASPHQTGGTYLVWPPLARF